MASLYAVDDSMWLEVLTINGYAVFLGYLMMGVRGLGLLVVTWTTVVLLGGFVSDLEKKDFWCLTGITLIQTAGVFNFLLKEKLSDMVHSWWGLLAAVLVAIKDDKEEVEGKKMVVTILLVAIQVFVHVIVLCPLGALYMLGLYISTGVSLWRLIEHDFGNAGGANQKPALQVLYGLAVAQGMLFGYKKTIHALGPRNRLAKFGAEVVGTVDEELVAGYLEETIAGCEKDPSFATGRNFVTYGVNLMMEAKSNEGFIAGIRVLGGAIKDPYPRGQMVLAKHLLTRSDSWSYMIQRLLDTVIGPRSPYSRDVREHAARIVALIARGIRLEQFPGMIEVITSVLDTSAEESNQQDSQFYRINRKYGRRKSAYYYVRIHKLEACNGLNNYERVELLEEYDLDYLISEHKNKGSPDFSLSSLIQWLVQCLLCKRKKKERRRENTVHGFDGLLTEAVNIIHQLAVDEDNRISMITSNTMLQHKIAMAPLKFHRNNHYACRVYQKSELQMLEKCWVVTEWLGAAVKDSNNQGCILEGAPSGGGDRRQEGDLLRSKVGSTLENAIIISIKTIFDCLDCRATQKKQGIQILLHLSLDLSSIMDNESGTRRLTWILLLIIACESYGGDDSEYWMVCGFTDTKKNECAFDSIRCLARKKLEDMLQEKHELPSEESERKLQLILLALGDLTTAFVDDAQDISIRTHAAIIMEGLCYGYRSYIDLALTKQVKGMLVDVIPKVVKEILVRCASTREERQAQGTDVENGGVSQGDALESRTCQDDGYTDNGRLRKVLISLCRDGYMENFWLRPEFKKIAPEICKQQGKSFKYFKSLLVV